MTITTNDLHRIAEEAYNEDKYNYGIYDNGSVEKSLFLRGFWNGVTAAEAALHEEPVERLLPGYL